MSVRTNDVVQVIAGKERGKTGRVIRINRHLGRVYVEGLNIIKRHKKPTAVDSKGGIIESEGPIDLSNVLLFSEKLQRGVRVSCRFVGRSGEYHATLKAARESFGNDVPERIQKVRLCVRTGEVL